MESELENETRINNLKNEIVHLFSNLKEKENILKIYREKGRYFTYFLFGLGHKSHFFNYDICPSNPLVHH